MNAHLGNLASKERITRGHGKIKAKIYSRRRSTEKVSQNLNKMNL